MNWMEEIKVGSGNSELSKVLPSIARLISARLPHVGLDSARILTRGDFAGEVMVIIVWSSSRVGRKKSSLAFLLQKELRRFGMTSYSAWEDQASFESTHLKTDLPAHKQRQTETQ